MAPKAHPLRQHLWFTTDGKKALDAMTTLGLAHPPQKCPSGHKWRPQYMRSGGKEAVRMACGIRVGTGGAIGRPRMGAAQKAKRKSRSLRSAKPQAKAKSKAKAKAKPKAKAKAAPKRKWRGKTCVGKLRFRNMSAFCQYLNLPSNFGPQRVLELLSRLLRTVKIERRVEERLKKSISFHTPIFENLSTDTVSEWLRRWTRNPLGCAREGSNPFGVGFCVFLFFPQLNEGLKWCR